jgi:RNA polymerase sigma-70 factor (ECF subfamily)
MPIPAWSPAPSRVAEWFAASEGARWGVSAEAFHDALYASVAHGFADRTPEPADVDRYLAALHHRDLALAVACASGSDAAWETLMREYRPVLHRAADAMDPSGSAREAADALYGELYGVRDRGGARQSLFKYFHGRSSLATWLRAVLAQRVVDRARVVRRVDPLPEADESPLADPSAAAPDPARAPCVTAIAAALTTAVEALEARDRLRLGLYYVQHLTLAEIGRLLKEHEGSVSRHLTRVRGEIRDAMAAHLRDEAHLAEAAIEECLRSVMDDAGALDLGRIVGNLTANTAAGKNSARNRSRV